MHRCDWTNCLSHLNCGSHQRDAGAHSCGTRRALDGILQRSGVQVDRPVTDGVDGTVQLPRTAVFSLLGKPMGVMQQAATPRYRARPVPGELRHGLFW